MKSVRFITPTLIHYILIVHTLSMNMQKHDIIPFPNYLHNITLVHIFF